jgi:hypothetical protein
MSNQSAYDQGFIDGLSAFTTERSAVKYVGALGTTLADAIKMRRSLETYRPLTDAAIPTTQQRFAEIEDRLKAFDWTYDVADEKFKRADGSIVARKDILAATSDVSLNELTDYVARKQLEWLCGT